MVSTRPLISNSSSPCTNPLMTVPSAPITIGIIVALFFLLLLWILLLLLFLLFVFINPLKRILGPWGNTFVPPASFHEPTTYRELHRFISPALKQWRWQANEYTYRYMHTPQSNTYAPKRVCTQKRRDRKYKTWLVGHVASKRNRDKSVRLFQFSPSTYLTYVSTSASWLT